MDNVVVMIGFFGDLDIEFGEAVESLGEPESLIVFQIGGPAPIFGTTTHTIVYAVTPTVGLSIGLDTISWRGEIKPKMQTGMIYYFDPDMYNTLLEVGMFSKGYLDTAGTIDITQPWTGFGSVNIIAPSK
jgi:hypothetical protein